MNKKNGIALSLLVLLILLMGGGLYYVSTQNTTEGLSDTSHISHKQKDNIRILLPFAIDAFPLFTLNDQALIILKNVYEPLVDFDNNLSPQPVLATSWGMLTPNIWEFTLRQDVVFHNGKPFGADDVLFSWEKVKTLAPSETKEQFSNIKEIKQTAPYKLQIILSSPDPLLLSKLRYLSIIPANLTDEQLRHFPSNMVGTGAYTWTSNSNGVVTLTRFDQYYKRDEVPFQTMTFIIVPQKFARLELIQNKSVDLMVAVPGDFVSTVTSMGYRTEMMPTLESVFLLYNLNASFASEAERKTFASRIDFTELQKLVGSFGIRASQFIPSGVFGFHPDITIPSSQTSVPKDTKEFLTIRLSQNNQSLAEVIAGQLEKQNIKLNIAVEDDPVLLSDLKNGNGDLFLLGWKFSDGDALDFLSSFFHTNKAGEGIYNGLGYNFPNVDTLIDQAAEELDPSTRLKFLQEAIRAISDETVGIPLFESRMMYAYVPDLSFTPSMDGMITYRNF